MRKRRLRCTVNNCVSTILLTGKETISSSISFHRFPKNALELRKKWIIFCKQKDHFDWTNSRICSKHFEKDCYDRDLKHELLNLPLRKLLKDGACPTIYSEQDLIRSEKSAVRGQRLKDRETRQQIRALVDQHLQKARCASNETVSAPVPWDNLDGISPNVSKKTGENTPSVQSRPVSQKKSQLYFCLTCQTDLDLEFNDDEDYVCDMRLFLVNLLGLDYRILLRDPGPGSGKFPFCLKCSEKLKALKTVYDELQMLNLKYSLLKKNFMKSLIVMGLRYKGHTATDTEIQVLMQKWEAAKESKTVGVDVKNERNTETSTSDNLEHYNCPPVHNFTNVSQTDYHNELLQADADIICKYEETEIKYENGSPSDMYLDDNLTYFGMEMPVSDFKEYSRPIALHTQDSNIEFEDDSLQESNDNAYIFSENRKTFANIIAEDGSLAKEKLKGKKICKNLTRKSKIRLPKPQKVKRAGNLNLTSCETCGKMVHPSHLESHIRLHTGEKPFLCAECGKTFGREGYLKAHQKTHANEKMFLCQDCGIAFRTDRNRKRHRVKMHGKKELRKGQLDIKLANEFASSRRVYFCELCSWNYNHKYRFLRHLKVSHGDIVKEKQTYNFYYCDANECSSSFQTLKRLHDHITTVHNKETQVRFECQNCQRMFCHAESLEIHGKCHLEDKVYYGCTFCYEVFNSEPDLEDHKPRHQVLFDVSMYSHLCEECGQEFTKLRILKKHIKERHSCSEEKEMNSGTAFKRLHTNEFQFLPPKNVNSFQACTICGRKFRKSYMRSHMVRQHQHQDTGTGASVNTTLVSIARRSQGKGNRGVTHCPHCNEPISGERTRERRKHMTMRHPEEYLKSRQYYCKVCFLNFLTIEEKSKHVTDFHRNVKCTVEGCDKKFSDSKKLRNHLNVHNKVKPHLCSYCQQGFANESNLTLHIDMKHTFHRSYLCKLCPENPGYFTRRELRTHALSKHETIALEELLQYNKRPKNITLTKE